MPDDLRDQARALGISEELIAAVSWQQFAPKCPAYLPSPEDVEEALFVLAALDAAISSDCTAGANTAERPHAGVP